MFFEIENESISAKKALEEALVGRLDHLWPILVAVHNERHAEGEDNYLTVLGLSRHSLLPHQMVNRLEHSWNHVHDKLMGPATGLEANGEAASEAGHNDVPTIDFLTRILRETEHVLESGHVEGQKAARAEDVLHCEGHC